MAEEKEVKKEKKVLYEAQKNYLVCAVLMIIAGIGLVIMSKPGIGYGCIFLGILFFVGAIALIKKHGLMTVTDKGTTYAEDEPEKKHKKHNKDK